MPPAPAPVVPPHLPPLRLLLVDDDPIIRETLGTILQHEGFKVTPAANGEEAEAMLAEAFPPFELVITDLVMPGKGGIDVLKAAMAADPNCTVLVLTGYGNIPEAAEAVELGAYGLVTKPLQVEAFRQTLRRLVERALLLHERDELKRKLFAIQARAEELEAVLGRMEMLAKQITPKRPEGPLGDGLEDLHRLASLKERGLLSDDQFEASKRAILARWAP
ncbi:MAG: response regulator [Acidobacteria bacterium]|nr:response regulator [Acidobacteriota bacterium]